MNIWSRSSCRPAMMGCFAVFVAYSSAVNAHHSMTWHFDREIEIELEGVIREFKLVSPHSRLLLDVTAEDGRVELWDCELNGASGSVRRGWTDDVFEPGQTIAISAYAARRNQRECYYRVGVLGDGRSIARNEVLAEDQRTVTAVSRTVSTSGEVPNLSGYWLGPGAGGGPPQPGDENPHAWVLSEAGLRALAEYDPITEDPSLDCKPVSIRRLWTSGGPTEIRQDDNVLVIRHEFMAAERVIYLDGRGHPAELEESPLGYSIGRFEDGVLIIDTIGYEAGVIYQFPGLPHSNQLHTVERVTLGDDGQSFEISWVAEDPEYFADRLTGTHRWEANEVAPGAYGCVHPELGVVGDTQ